MAGCLAPPRGQSADREHSLLLLLDEEGRHLYTIPVPGLPDAESRLAVPAMAFGNLVGVLVVESRRQIAFTPDDEAALSVVASLVATTVELERARSRADDPGAAPAGVLAARPRGGSTSAGRRSASRSAARVGSACLWMGPCASTARGPIRSEVQQRGMWP